MLESVRQESNPRAELPRVGHPVDEELDQELDPPLEPAPSCLSKESAISSTSVYIDTAQPTDGSGDLERVLNNSSRRDELNAPSAGASPPVPGAERSASRTLGEPPPPFATQGSGVCCRRRTVTRPSGAGATASTRASLSVARETSSVKPRRSTLGENLRATAAAVASQCGVRCGQSLGLNGLKTQPSVPRLDEHAAVGMPGADVGGGGDDEHVEVTVLARSTRRMPLDEQLKQTLKSIIADRREAEFLEHSGSIVDTLGRGSIAGLGRGSLSMLPLPAALREAGGGGAAGLTSQLLPPVEALGAKERNKQLLMVSVLINGEVVEHPIAGDVQKLHATQFLQQREQLLRLMRERLARERTNLRRLQRRADRKRPAAIFVNARAGGSSLWQRLRQQPAKEQVLLLCIFLQVTMLFVQSADFLVGASQRARDDEESRAVAGAFLGAALLLLALRMAKPMWGLLSEEDSAELAICAAVSIAVLAFNAYDHMNEEGSLRYGLGIDTQGEKLGVALLVVQALNTTVLVLFSLLVHREFGWRTFSRVAARHMALRAHTALLRLRTLLQWSAIFTGVQLLGVVLVLWQADEPLPGIAEQLGVALIALDVGWLALTACTFATQRYFLCLLRGCGRSGKTRAQRAQLGLTQSGGSSGGGGAAERRRELWLACRAAVPARLILLLLLGAAHPAWLFSQISMLWRHSETQRTSSLPGLAGAAALSVALRAYLLGIVVAVWRERLEIEVQYARHGKSGDSGRGSGGSGADGGGGASYAETQKQLGVKLKLPRQVRRYVRTAQQEESLFFCRTGTLMLLLNVNASRKHTRERFFQLSEDLSTLRWSWTDYLLVDEIIDVQYKQSQPLTFTIVYAHSAMSLQADLTLTLACKKQKHAMHWVSALQLLCHAYAHASGLPSSELTLLKAAFKTISGSSGKETLSLAQQQEFFQCLNRFVTRDELAAMHKRATRRARASVAAEGAAERGGAPPSDASVRELFSSSVENKPGGWHSMLHGFVELVRQEEIERLFARHANWGLGGTRMSLEDFRDFWRKEQGGDSEEAARIFEVHAEGSGIGSRGDLSDEGTATLSIRSFQRLLLSHNNAAFDPRHERVCQDMTQPLPHYYICSSHNTFLKGNQLTSDSSTDMYRRVLLQGCRCVEIDCFDGADGEPEVYHKMSVTSRIRFRDVVLAINETAFVASPYPVILSLEMHCSLPQQETLAQILIDVFGEKLQRPLPRVGAADAPGPAALAAAAAGGATSSSYGSGGLGSTAVAPDSPEALKNKIVVKGKRLVAKLPADILTMTTEDDSDSDDSDDDSSDDEPSAVNAAGVVARAEGRASTSQSVGERLRNMRKSRRSDAEATTTWPRRTTTTPPRRRRRRRRRRNRSRG